MPRLSETISLIVGPSAHHLTTGLFASIGKRATVECRLASLRSFPDGEFCVELGAPSCGTTTVIVQGTHRPQSEHWLQLLQMVEAAAHHGAKRIICAVPYFGFGRQDKQFKPGEPVTSRMLLELLANLGCRRIITVDIHNPSIAASSGLTLVNLHAAELLEAYLPAARWRNAVWVSPDAGGAARVSKIAARLGGETAILEKSKDRTGYTWYRNQEIAVSGKDAIVIDDVCSTGSTLVPLSHFLAKAGANRITYFATHFFADAAAIKSKAGVALEIFSSNTVPNSCQLVAIEESIAEAIVKEIAP
jgi:ribose-phosphate pyrophosphokinase